MRHFDIHTHILPGIDDGAANKEQSLEMIKELKSQGITDVILTPHFYHFESSLNRFIRKRNEAFQEISSFFDQVGITPHLGAEVYLVNMLFNIEDFSELCIDKGNYVLIELPFGEWNSSKVINMIHRLCANFQIIPIIAHIEKYPAFFNEKFIKEMRKLDCLLHIDIESLKNPFLRAKIKKFIEKGYIQFAGSDCHNTKNRKPNFDVLKKYLPEIMYNFLLDNTDITF